MPSLKFIYTQPTGTQQILFTGQRVTLSVPAATGLRGSVQGLGNTAEVSVTIKVKLVERLLSVTPVSMGMENPSYSGATAPTLQADDRYKVKLDRGSVAGALAQAQSPSAVRAALFEYVSNHGGRVVEHNMPS